MEECRHSRVHVVLEGQDDGERGRLEGTLRYGLNHLLKTGHVPLKHDGKTPQLEDSHDLKKKRGV